MTMDLWSTKANMVLFTLALLGCVQGVPVANEQTDGLVHLQPSGQSSDANSNNEKSVGASVHNDQLGNDVINKMAGADNNNNNNDNTELQSGSQRLPLLSQKGQGEPVARPLPLSKSLAPLTKAATGNGNSHPIDVSKEFTKKVLQAFFTELKNRPDLVDEILRRETYKLLMSIAQDDGDYNPIPPEVELTQELVPVPALQGGGQSNSQPENPTSISDSETGPAQEKDNISKKSAQEVGNVKPGKGTPLVGGSVPLGDDGSSKEDASTVQAALGKELDKIDPYYYYVYYDENEVPNSSSADKDEENAQPPAANNDDKVGTQSQDEMKNEHVITGDQSSSNVPVSAGQQTDDVVVDKIALAVRSAITRDMEEQLAKNRLAHIHSMGADGGRLQQVEGNLAHAASQKSDVQTNQQQSNEEMELTNLTQ